LLFDATYCSVNGRNTHVRQTATPAWNFILTGAFPWHLGQSYRAWQATALSANSVAYLMANPRSQPPATQRPPRILIIEDELLIALLIEEMVREIGYRVSRVAYTMAIARQEFVKRNFDAVLLDINIGGRYQPEVADFLQNMGVPFAFVTGYDYLIVPRHQTVPVLQKPFTVVQLRALLDMLVSPGALSGELAQTVKHFDAGPAARRMR
jgi:CheY-like chemotaxis protein